MVFVESLKRSGFALAVVAALGLPGAAHAQRWHGGGIGTGAAVGIGLGSFALGTALGSAAYRPYGYYPYGYYAPAPVYYAPPPPVAYRTCWYPQYGGYFAC
jgi:hypothetical protein